jgi:peptidoglycan/xylan/chitin deacetylase (PgdA/CDA1 family)
LPEVRLEGWSIVPLVGVILPQEGAPGWTDGALWLALLEAWGVPAAAVSPDDVGARPWTTIVAPAAAVDAALADALQRLDGAAILLAGASSVGAGQLVRRPTVVPFEPSANALTPATSESTVDAAETALLAAAPAGLVSLWRWPDDADLAFVVDGDVDHPTGIDPECARYVAPAIETARRAGYPAYGIFAAAANVDAEPSSFPPGAEYYNHSYTHPYSYWNPEPWDALDEARMRDELMRSDETFRRHLGVGDHRMFRLPHFQLDACDRTYDVLETLGYRADSSIGANVALTGGLPFHPARRAWSARPEDAAYARTHPNAAERRPFLQLPISTDPTAPDFPHGCCSYNTLGEGVRARTAEPSAYEDVLQTIVDTAAARRGLAHVFIDPPDAGYGRLPADAPDYASGIERWLARAVTRDDVAVLSTAGLATWWLAREDAVRGLSMRADVGDLIVDLPETPRGAMLAVRGPGAHGVWRRIPIEEGGAR